MNEQRLRAYRKTFIASALCAALIGSAMVSTQTFSHQNEATHNQLPNFKQLVQQNIDAVVSVRGNRKAQTFTDYNAPESRLPDSIPEPFRRFFEGDENRFGPRFFEGIPKGFTPSVAQGSGFIISDDGYVLTNAHVVADSDDITVRLTNRTEYKAELIGMDKRTDVALLKVEASGLPTVEIGDSDALGVGDWLLAIGSPFGFDYSASQGIVSALGRSLPDGTYVPFIQTDVAVNPGNSGGPLFNLDGQVVGINSQIYSRSGGYQGISFAIPINLALNIAEQLKTKGVVSRGWLGVMIQDMSQALAQSFGLEKPMGALVSQVLAGSPAEAAGIKVGDVIVDFADQAIEHSSQLPPLVGSTAVGEKTKIEVLREGKKLSLNVVIEELEEADAPKLLSKAETSDQKLGVSVAELDADKRKSLSVDHGVIIGEIMPGSPAAKAGLREGDVILSFNRKPVNNAKELAEAVKDTPADKPAVVLVKREQGTLFIPVEIG